MAIVRVCARLCVQTNNEKYFQNFRLIDINSIDSHWLAPQTFQCVPHTKHNFMVEIKKMWISRITRQQE